MGKVYLNAQIMDASDARIPVSDGGFLYGAGLFETLRVQRGRVFGLTDHMDRLFASAAKLGFDLPLDRDGLAAAVQSVLQANELAEARVRVTVSAGSMAAESTRPVPTVLVTATGLTAYPDEYYAKGVMAILSPYRQNPADPLAGHKATSYFSRMLGLQFAHERQAAESLGFTTDGYLAEGCVSNVFLVKDEVLLTPPLGTPVLPGVARLTVKRIAEARGLALEERALVVDDLLGADEVFLTNVIMKVLPVIAIEKHTVADGRVGPLTGQIRTWFDEEIERQCTA